MSIRHATATDAIAIAEIHVAAWRAAYIGQMPQAFLDGLSVAERAKIWQRALTEPSPGTTLVIECERHIVGFCVYGPSRDSDASADTGELVAVNLHPSYWRRGLGSIACQYVLADAKRRDWTTMTLWVLKENVRAQRFYKQLGFVPDGHERRDTQLVGAPLNEVRYRMSLP